MARFVPLHVSNRSPVKVVDPHKPDACTVPPHHWMLDSKSFGTCDHCPATFQFPISASLTFADSHRDCAGASIKGFSA